MVPPQQQEEEEVQRFPLPDLSAAPQIKMGTNTAADAEQEASDKHSLPILREVSLFLLFFCFFEIERGFAFLNGLESPSQGTEKGKE